MGMTNQEYTAASIERMMIMTRKRTTKTKRRGNEGKPKPFTYNFNSDSIPNPNFSSANIEDPNELNHNKISTTPVTMTTGEVYHCTEVHCNAVINTPAQMQRHMMQHGLQESRNAVNDHRGYTTPMSGISTLTQEAYKDENQTNVNGDYTSTFSAMQRQVVDVNTDETTSNTGKHLATENIHDYSNDPGHAVGFKCNCGAHISEANYVHHMATVHGDIHAQLGEVKMPVTDIIPTPEDDIIVGQNTNPNAALNNNLVKFRQGTLSTTRGSEDTPAAVEARRRRHQIYENHVTNLITNLPLKVIGESSHAVMDWALENGATLNEAKDVDAYIHPEALGESRRRRYSTRARETDPATLRHEIATDHMRYIKKKQLAADADGSSSYPSTDDDEDTFGYQRGGELFSSETADNKIKLMQDNSKLISDRKLINDVTNSYYPGIFGMDKLGGGMMTKGVNNAAPPFNTSHGAIIGESYRRLHGAEIANYNYGAEPTMDNAGNVKDGYDEDGYDEDGLNKAGFDGVPHRAEGPDGAGYDMEGFDEGGFDEDGYDMAGYTADGFDQFQETKRMKSEYANDMTPEEQAADDQRFGDSIEELQRNGTWGSTMESHRGYAREAGPPPPPGGGGEPDGMPGQMPPNDQPEPVNYVGDQIGSASINKCLGCGGLGEVVGGQGGTEKCPACQGSGRFIIGEGYAQSDTINDTGAGIGSSMDETNTTDQTETDNITSAAIQEALIRTNPVMQPAVSRIERSIASTGGGGGSGESAPSISSSSNGFSAMRH